MNTFRILPLVAGVNQYTFALGNEDQQYSVLISTFYNYSLQMWFLNISDYSTNPLADGIAIIPNQPLLSRYPDLKALAGELVSIERKIDDYRKATALGTDLLLLWYPVGTEVVIPT